MKTVLYIFSGKRKQLIADVAAGRAPDTQLYGMNHIASDLNVATKEFADTFLGKIFGNKLGFRLRHMLMYFWARQVDIVFGASLIYMMPLWRLFGARGKVVLLNISLNRFLNENAGRPARYRWALRQLGSVEKIVCLSHVQLDELARRHAIPAQKLVYVPLGVDTKFHQPVYEGRKDYFLAVGRDNGRDYKTLIEVAAKMPDKKFELVLSKRNLVGVGDIPKNVKVLFDISAEELRKKYQEAAALLLITHADGHGDGADCSGQTVLLDAFASGLPVIASRKAYLADYGQNGQDLTLVDFYDSSAIIQAIEQLNPTLARNARRRTETEFSTAKMGEHISALFRSL